MIKVSKEEYVKQAITLGQNFLKKNDLEGFYQLMEKKCSPITIGLVTEFFESKGIHLEDHLTRVPAAACWSCHIPSRWLYLDRLNLPDKFKTIGNISFGYCSDLKAVSIEGVETIGEYAFSDCYNLDSVQFGPNISYIDQTAFRGCKKLTTFLVPDEATAKRLKDMCRYLTSPKGSQEAEIDIWIDKVYYYDTVIIS